MVATFTGDRFACCASEIESSWSPPFPLPKPSQNGPRRPGFACAAPKRRALDRSGPFWRTCL